MADPVTTAFQTTLLVLYFVTPAVTVDLQPGEKNKFETSKIWTLQSPTKFRPRTQTCAWPTGNCS